RPRRSVGILLSDRCSTTCAVLRHDPACTPTPMNQTDTPKRVAIVTGGIGGLGTEICRQLVAAGRQVIAVDLAARAERIEAFRRELADLDGAIAFEPADVSDFDSCRQLAAHVEEHYGSIDILVNAAGITRDASLRKMTPQQWHELMHVNLDGVFNLCRNVIEGMTARGFGRIVNISS